MSKNQRRKGAQWERDIVIALKAHGFDATRTAPMQTDGLPYPDVTASPLWIEAKCGAQPPIIRGLAQAESNMPAEAGWIAVCVAKSDRRPPTVTMRWSDFLDLLREWAE